MLLASTIEFGWAETVVLAAVSGIVQCIWRAKKQPAPIQIAFSASSLVISATVAFHLAHLLVPDAAVYSTFARVAVATPALFAANSLLMAVLFSLLQSDSAFAFWRRIHLWTFPRYVLAAAVTAMLFVVSGAAGIAVPWLALPVLYLQFAYQREAVVNRVA